MTPSEIEMAGPAGSGAADVSDAASVDSGAEASGAEADGSAESSDAEVGDGEADDGGASGDPALGMGQALWNGVRIIGAQSLTNGAAMTFVDAINHALNHTPWGNDDGWIILGSVLGVPEMEAAMLGLRALSPGFRTFLDAHPFFNDMIEWSAAFNFGALTTSGWPATSPVGTS